MTTISTTPAPVSTRGTTRGSRVRRLASICLLLGALTVAPGTTAGADTSRIDLRDCGLTVHFMKVDAPHGQTLDDTYLPTGYTRAEFYGPGTASVAPWIFGCDRVEIDGEPVGPAVLSFIAIQITDRFPPHPFPNFWDHYVVWSQSDNPSLVKALRAAGQPARNVPRMQFVWSGDTDDRTTRVHVPWGGSPYEVSVRAMDGTDTPHDHDNTFQHGNPAAGRSILRLTMEFPIDDLLCAPQLDPGCAVVSGEPGTKVADFFAHAEIVLAADHTGPLHAAPTKIDHAVLEISRG